MKYGDTISGNSRRRRYRHSIAHATVNAHGTAVGLWSDRLKMVASEQRA